MPFYRFAAMGENQGKINPKLLAKSVKGEFMKAALVTRPDAEGNPLHMHPNEEQFLYVLEGKVHFILGDEDRIIGPGEFVHVPRFVYHRSRPVDGPAVTLSIKSPAGTGEMSEDYNKAERSDEAEKLYPGKSKA
jgi:mannose-6-phosphate isomerase-like protein (cupin superfamily)